MKHEYRWMGASAVRSPLNMGESGEGLFLNNWNLNQTFFLKGATTESRYENLLQILKKRCPGATIVEETDSIGAKVLEPHEILSEIKKLKIRAIQFNKLLQEFRLQVRYSLMALLSENKVSLFNQSMLELMSFLLQKQWNNSEASANFAAFILDNMHFELDPVRRPDENLNKVFTTIRKEPRVNQEF